MHRNFYTAAHAPYYIVGLDYIQQSAGIRALHYLCHALNETGYEAYITCQTTAVKLRTPVLTGEVLERHHAAGRKPIVVYPEIIPGDPLATGGVVVRWLLHKPGHIAGDTSFPETELLFAYDRDYLPPGRHCELFHLPTCDLSLFNNEDNPLDGQRDQVCFYAHKYLHHGGTLTEHVKNATSLGKERKLSHAEIATILRRAKVLYVYEQTALIAEALLCGCPVAVIDTEYWRNTAAPYVSDFGVAYFDDSQAALSLAKSRVPQYRIIHDRLVQQAWEQLDHFIEITQHAAANRR